MTGAFVIQYHQTNEGSHFDFMLEVGQSLATFQLPMRPDQLPPGEQITVPRLADHRLAYLTYEGPISGDRGRVQIVDRGTFTASTFRDDLWVIQLNGQLARGEYRLHRLGERQYTLARAPQSSD